MKTYIGLFIIAFTSISSVYGSTCSLNNQEGLKSIVDSITNSCPPLFGPSDKEFCCIDLYKSKFYCCTASEYYLETGLGIIVPAIIAVVVIVSCIVFCISCLCCSCCPWYKRRHRGTVYGHVQTTGVTVLPPGNQVIHTVYPTQPVPLPATLPPYSAQPPPYNAEVYAKQSPYNPNYPTE